MDKANDIITNIIKEVLTALYQPFGAAVLMVCLFFFTQRNTAGRREAWLKIFLEHGLEILRKALHLEGLSFWCFILL